MAGRRKNLKQEELRTHTWQRGIVLCLAPMRKTNCQTDNLSFNARWVLPAVGIVSGVHN